MAPLKSPPYLVLATVCSAVFAINLDTTIVNLALPTLVRQLGASTRDLQWIVDGYNLSFAALVLAGGALGDRLGRKPTLVGGLVVFAAASVFGATCTSPGELVVARVVMGMAAACIFPTTLSIITNTFTERTQRAKAVGIWGAVTGLGVAVGPVAGGVLLAHFWWGSIFLALVPFALLAAVATVLIVEESKAPATHRFDLVGLGCSTAAITALVWTIIEAPDQGWGSTSTIVGFAVAALAAIAFVVVEAKVSHPMLEVSLFTHRAFTAASASVTIAFFALAGFIFLITQYMQFVRGFSTISTGARILPVACSIAVGSVVGAQLVRKLGTRSIVMVGLALFGSAFLWIAASATEEPYLQIAIQMVVMGLGLGLTSAPATESILSVLPPAKAGVGSAVNDATREAGGTLGVAVIGSIATSAYLHHLNTTAVATLPPALANVARRSVGAGLELAAHAPRHQGVLHAAVVDSFMTGLRTGCVVAAGVCYLGVLVASMLPGRSAPEVHDAVGTTHGSQLETAAEHH